MVDIKTRQLAGHDVGLHPGVSVHGSAPWTEQVMEILPNALPDSVHFAGQSQTEAEPRLTLFQRWVRRARHFFQGVGSYLKYFFQSVKRAFFQPPSTRTRYPAIEPYQTHMLPVSDKHTLYIEEVGNPNGYPIVSVHGGPGGGSSPAHRRYFDPNFYRIILIDQRGAGKSTPFASLEENTTPDLVEDMEKVRKHLGIEKWALRGHSWGSTLSLAYAQAHPERVSAMVLGGIFLGRKQDIHWLYQDGASRIYPDSWEEFLRPVPEEERGDMVGAYRKLLTHPDKDIRLDAAKAWSIWEGSILNLVPDMETIKKFEADDKALALARIENHFFVHNDFFDDDNQLLNNIDKVRHIPTWIYHGRYDTVCALKNAWDLHRAFPEAQMNTVDKGGHGDVGHAAIEATEALKSMLKRDAKK